MALCYYDGFQQVTCNYDLSGVPIAQEVGQYNSAGTITDAAFEKFIMDGDNVLFDFTKQYTGSLTLAHRFLYRPVIDEILAQEAVSDLNSAGTVLWQVTDNQNSVRDLVNSNGTSFNEGSTNIITHPNVVD